MIALVPARAGSKRVPNKNIRLLGGKPLIHWTIQPALDSGLFSRVVVSSDSDDILASVGAYDVLPLKRPSEFARDGSPDIDWVKHALDRYNERPESFAILRPTSPFRTVATLQRAFNQFQSYGNHVDSMRAVEPSTQHPGKMWWFRGENLHMLPVIGGPNREQYDTPMHSSPTQTLRTAYVQNASLEMARTSVVYNTFPSIAGVCVMPFLTQGIEGFDINTPEDWAEAERIVDTLYATA